MPTLNLQVNASGNDGFETNSGNVSITGTTELSDGLGEYLAFRFTSVTIPQGATVSSAVLQLCIPNSGEDEPQHTIRGEASDNAAIFQAIDENISLRAFTSATVDWDSTDLGSGTNQFFSSPSIVTIIQEIVSRPGWVSGNALALMINQHAPASAARDLGAVMYDSSPSNAAKLDITYAATGGGPNRMFDFVTGKSIASMATGSQIVPFNMLAV